MQAALSNGEQGSFIHGIFFSFLLFYPAVLLIVIYKILSQVILIQSHDKVKSLPFEAKI